MKSVVARELMTPDILSVSEDLSLSELATFLVDHQITGAAVQDAEGRFVGVVSLTDLAEARAVGGSRMARARPDFYVRGWEESLDEEDLSNLHLEGEDLKVSDVLTRKIYSVSPNATSNEVAETMLAAHIHRVFVTDGQKPVGIISTSDLLGLLVEEQ